jgi:hypothetical protein
VDQELRDRAAKQLDPESNQVAVSFSYGDERHCLNTLSRASQAHRPDTVPLHFRGVLREDERRIAALEERSDPAKNMRDERSSQAGQAVQSQQPRHQEEAGSHQPKSSNWLINISAFY